MKVSCDFSLASWKFCFYSLFLYTVFSMILWYYALCLKAAILPSEKLLWLPVVDIYLFIFYIFLTSSLLYFCFHCQVVCNFVSQLSRCIPHGKLNFRLLFLLTVYIWLSYHDDANSNSTEMEQSSGWLPWSSLSRETLKTSFIVSSDDQGSHPDDLSVSMNGNTTSFYCDCHSK